VILSSRPDDATAWQLFSSGSCVLALPADATPDGIVAVLSEPDPFRRALEALVDAGIAAAPPFALLEGDAQVLRVVVRGDASIVATLADEGAAGLTISGAGVATWSERVIEGVCRVELRVPGSSWTIAPASLPPAIQTAPITPMAVATAAETTLVPRAEPESEAYDFLFGDTVSRTQADETGRIPNPDPTRPGDHDGQTLFADGLARIGDPPMSPSAPGRPAPTLPLAPSLQLERADGGRERLTQPVIIGRAPTAPATASPAPRLVTIADDKDISRSHLRAAVEGNVVVITDLASKNGTVITLPGAAPRALRAGEPTVVLPGTLIDLGGGVTFTVRED
jgi:hypothetical protein